MKVSSSDRQTVDIVLVEQLSVAKAVADIVRPHRIGLYWTRHVTALVCVTPSFNCDFFCFLLFFVCLLLFFLLPFMRTSLSFIFFLKKALKLSKTTAAYTTKKQKIEKKQQKNWVLVVLYLPPNSLPFVKQ